jgi:outer membrane protein OmpA-like peptidoglycan-associated protein
MMKFRNFYLLAAVLLFFTSSVEAQNAKLEKAKRYMKEFNYQEAISLLKQITDNKDNAEAKINLAECYRKVGDSPNAEFLYGQVVRMPEAQPIHYLFYGEMLQRNGKCDLAKEWYLKFNQAVPEDVRGQYMSKACDYEEELKTKGLSIYDVQRANFNSQYDDFGSTFYKDGIVFASERDKGVAIKREHSWTGRPFLDLYFVPIKGCGTEVTYGRPESFASDINTKYHDAAVTFNKEQNVMFFTRNNYSKGKSAGDDDGVMKLKVYTSKKSGKSGWAGEEALPFNSDEYSCAHPTLSEDGTKLYFASDMPGGFGGMDIYVSEQENGKWGPPVNLGPGINTEGHELFPFMHKSGRLYFASDGHLGLGGMDIHYVDDKGNGQWSAPENVGAPINSQEDDFSLSLNEDGTCGFFSSDRAGGAGHDDVYSFTKKAAPLKVYVYDADTKAAIEGATVVADSLNRTMKTGKDGKAMVEMKFNTCSNFAASMEGYEPATKQGCVKDASSAESNTVEIPLRKMMKHTVAGVVFDLATGLPLGGATVSLLGGTKDTSTVTDASGRYSFPLENEFCYKIKGEKEKYFAETTPDTICTKGLTGGKDYLVNLNLQQSNATPTKPTGDVVDGGTPDKSGDKPTDNKGSKKPKLENGVYVINGNPAEGEYNGVKYKKGKPEGKFVPSETEYPTKPGESPAVAYLLHVYYDFDQSFLRDESKPELEKLYKLMTDNPNYIVEIASHTDARGSNSYNNRLSQRRAESVVKWLADKGIERDRLVPRGYGESMSANKCKGTVRCEEEEHQMNRRTEFRVLGCKDCVDKTKVKLSKPNPNAKVDRCQGCPF